MDRRPDPNAEPFPDGATIRRGIRVRRGLAVDVATETEARDPDHPQSSRWAFSRPFASVPFDLMDALAPPGRSRVLDLGAHVGTFAARLGGLGPAACRRRRALSRGTW